MGAAPGGGGGARAFAFIPPAPPMFSTTTCWPSTSDRRAARMRPTVSEALPAANGTTNVIGRVGQFWVGRVCVITDEDASAIVSAAIERHRLKKRSMLGSSWLAVWPLARSTARTVPGRQGDLPRYP